MTRIDDLPDDPKFTIKAVAAQTGIRPVTLRAWERRHEVLTPQRADNRYRLYSERDVAILRWLKNRVDEGIAISNAVSELRSLTTNDTWPEAIPTVPAPALNNSQTPPEQYANQLFQALIRHDENRASDILREIHSLFNVMTICNRVIVPALRAIGEAWYRGEIRVTTEHFASALLRGKMLALLQAYPARRTSANILVGCAPLEQHELGSLMLSVLLRSEGFRVEYLGPDIPVDDLVDYASYEQPAMIILSATSEESALGLRKLNEMLGKLRAAPLFGYGGRAFDVSANLREQVSGIYLGATLEEAVTGVHASLKTRTRSAA